MIISFILKEIEYMHFQAPRMPFGAAFFYIFINNYLKRFKSQHLLPMRRSIKIPGYGKIKMLVIIPL